MRLATHPAPSFLAVLAIGGAAAAALPAAGPNPPPNPAIAYIDAGALKVMNADGSNVRTVVRWQAAARTPAWSPDSTEIVYQQLRVYPF